jgi:hypothetical protein
VIPRKGGDDVAIRKISLNANFHNIEIPVLQSTVAKYHDSDQQTSSTAAVVDASR